jgi:hypothetical protein
LSLEYVVAEEWAMNTNFQDWESPPEGALPRWFQDRGRAFERIIKKVLDDAGCEPRGSLRPSGEEIDGSFYLGGKTYWHSPKPLDIFHSAV